MLECYAYAVGGETKKCAPFVFDYNTHTLTQEKRRELAGESRFSQSEYPNQATNITNWERQFSAAAAAVGLLCTENTQYTVKLLTGGHGRSIGTIRPSSEPSSSSFRFVISRGTEWIVIQSHIGPEQTRFFVSATDGSGIRIRFRVCQVQKRKDSEEEARSEEEVSSVSTSTNEASSSR